MATRFSDLSTASDLTGDEILALVQGGVSRKALLGKIIEKALGELTSDDIVALLDGVDLDAATLAGQQPDHYATAEAVAGKLGRTAQAVDSAKLGGAEAADYALRSLLGAAAGRGVGTTQGDLMEVGAFGFGAGQLPSWPLPSLSSDPTGLVSQLYRLTSNYSGEMPFGNAVGSLYWYNPSRAVFVIHEASFSGPTGTASKTWDATNGWSEWDISISTKTLVGPVGAGLPSAFEIGSNSNGHYLLLPGGWCFAYTDSLVIDGQSGTVNDNQQISGAWPTPVEPINGTACFVGANLVKRTSGSVRYEDFTFNRSGGFNSSGVDLKFSARDKNINIAGCALEVKVFAIYQWE